MPFVCKYIALCLFCLLGMDGPDKELAKNDDGDGRLVVLLS